jgi:hypothetical protein
LQGFSLRNRKSWLQNNRFWNQLKFPEFEGPGSLWRLWIFAAGPKRGAFPKTRLVLGKALEKAVYRPLFL